MTIKTTTEEQSKKEKRLTHRTATMRNSRPRFWHLPLPRKPIATPKQWQEPNPPANDQHIRLCDY